MTRNLIKKIWQETHRIDQRNEDQRKANGDQPTINKVTEFHHLSSHFFIEPEKSNISVSFHQAQANAMRHDHDFFEVMYVVKGTPIGIINDQKVIMNQGDFCIMNPQAVHYFDKYVDGEDLILNMVLPTRLFHHSVFKILFKDKTLSTFFIRYQMVSSMASYLMIREGPKEMEMLVSLLVTESLNQADHSKVAIQSLLTALFIHVIRHSGKQRSDTLMNQVLDTIYMTYGTVTLESLAKQYNYHPKYLSRLIRQETGVAFRQFIANLRLQNVVNYLLYTEVDIDDIVSAVGYSEKSSLYNAFRKQYDISPMAFRQKYARSH